MITSKERDIFDRHLSRARGSIANLEGKKQEHLDQIGRIDALLAEAQVELQALESQLKQPMDEFDAAQPKSPPLKER